MNWRERRQRQQQAARERRDLHHDLPHLLKEQRERLLKKGGPPHPEIPNDPRK